MVEFLSHHEVLQVLVVRPDLDQVLGSFQKVSPLFQRADDNKHLLEHTSQAKAQEAYWIVPEAKVIFN